MSELMETTNLILIVGFGIVIALIWVLIGWCVSINGNLKNISQINPSLNDLNERLRRKGLYKDDDEQNHSQFMN